MAARPETLLNKFLVSQPTTKRFRRHLAAIWMKQSQMDFEETGHPLRAWFALTMAWEAGLLDRVPRSVVLYFLQSAGHLLTGPVPRKTRVAKAVASALGLECRGRVNPFAEFRRPSHEQRVAVAVYMCRDAHRHYKMRAVFTQVAEEHGHCYDCSTAKKISVGTVKRYWYRHRKSVERLVSERQ